MLKTLIHVNEPERWPVAISNIINLLNDVGDSNIDVIVVSNGAGVKGYIPRLSGEGTVSGEVTVGEACIPGATVTSPLMDALKKMEELSKRGVKFLACRNALKANNIPEESLPDFVRVIPAGMTELIKRQAEGYAYIKP